jgi:hypothetical protein
MHSRDNLAAAIAAVILALGCANSETVSLTDEQREMLNRHQETEKNLLFDKSKAPDRARGGRQVGLELRHRTGQGHSVPVARSQSAHVE